MTLDKIKDLLGLGSDEKEYEEEHDEEHKDGGNDGEDVEMPDLEDNSEEIKEDLEDE